MEKSQVLDWMLNSKPVWKPTKEQCDKSPEQRNKWFILAIRNDGNVDLINDCHSIEENPLHFSELLTKRP